MVVFALESLATLHPDRGIAAACVLFYQGKVAQATPAIIAC